MSDKNGIVIFAPHIDDEVIGCWSYFKDRTPAIHAPNRRSITVMYFYELSYDRRQEAQSASALLDFKPIFSPTDSEIKEFVSEASTVLVPSRKDSHADHKAINAQYRHLATNFYSVDMVDATPLDYHASKLSVLDRCYPSQKELWTNNAKYYLFESIHDTDYDTYTTQRHTYYFVTYKQMYTKTVGKALIALHETNPQAGPDEIMNCIASVALTGRITVKDSGRGITLEL